MTFDSDRVLSVSAIGIGVASLFMVVYQTNLERQAQRASVLPYLYFLLTANNQGVAINVSNSGVGPALIEDVRIHYKGKTIATDPYDFFIGLRADAKTLPLAVDKVLPGRLIPAGVTVPMLSGGVPGAPDSQKLLPDFLRLFEIAEVPRAWYEAVGSAQADRAVVDITFKSVFGERWRIRSDRIVPEKQ